MVRTGSPGGKFVEGGRRWTGSHAAGPWTETRLGVRVVLTQNRDRVTGLRRVAGRVAPPSARVMLTGGTPPPPQLDGRSSYGLSETATAILRSGTLKIQSPGIGGELGGYSRCVAQRALGRPIQKMLRWRPLTARGPLSGVRPHTQVRRVYRGEGSQRAKKRALLWQFSRSRGVRGIIQPPCGERV